MNTSTQQALSKVPEVTLLFWIIKIAATTLGETGGDNAVEFLIHALRRKLGTDTIKNIRGAGWMVSKNV